MSVTTAYEQSQKAARALMESVRVEQNEADKARQIKIRHQHAFRTAFDYLDEMWEPRLDENYFALAAKRMNERWNNSEHDKLTHGLLLAVFNYLEQAAMEDHKS